MLFFVRSHRNASAEFAGYLFFLFSSNMRVFRAGVKSCNFTESLSDWDRLEMIICRQFNTLKYAVDEWVVFFLDNF